MNARLEIVLDLSTLKSENQKGRRAYVRAVTTNKVGEVISYKEHDGMWSHAHT